MKNKSLFINNSKEFLRVFYIIVLIVSMLLTLTSCKELIQKIDDSFHLLGVTVTESTWNEVRLLAQDDHDVIIPENAEIVHGKYYTSIEGLDLLLLFKVPENSACDLSDSWIIYTDDDGFDVKYNVNDEFKALFPDANWTYYAYLNGTIRPKFTYMYKSEPIENYVYYYFHLYNPSKRRIRYKRARAVLTPRKR